MKDYVFAIGYSSKKMSEKRDYFVLDIIYDIKKIKALNKKYKLGVDIIDIDKNYSNKEFNNLEDMDESMEKLLIHFGLYYLTITFKI